MARFALPTSMRERLVIVATSPAAVETPTPTSDSTSTAMRARRRERASSALPALAKPCSTAAALAELGSTEPPSRSPKNRHTNSPSSVPPPSLSSSSSSFSTATKGRSPSVVVLFFFVFAAAAAAVGALSAPRAPSTSRHASHSPATAHAVRALLTVCTVGTQALPQRCFVCIKRSSSREQRHGSNSEDPSRSSNASEEAAAVRSVVYGRVDDKGDKARSGGEEERGPHPATNCAA
mmetsp:Transcript_7424/g.15237  ORF Transcript_7424/g.15237 Transcript_7424/m.15237 type:complete len:236 (-) Transcript_7424:155-862(-)